MVCYIVPTATAVIHFFIRKGVPYLRKDEKQLWLNQLLLGGAVFGIIDHWWNKELFLIGKNVFMDIVLGFTITAVIILIWLMMIIFNKMCAKDTIKAST